MVLGQFSDICGYGSATNGSNAEQKLDENKNKLKSNSKKNN
jgi:hypothetical protein